MDNEQSGDEDSESDFPIYFVRGFFAIKWHIRLLRYPQMKWAWSEDPLKSQPEIKKNNVFKSVSVNVEALSCS